MVRDGAPRQVLRGDDANARLLTMRVWSSTKKTALHTEREQRLHGEILIMQQDLLTRHPRPALAATEHADATFDPQRIRARDRDMAFVALAVVGVINLSRPFVRPRRPHRGKQGKPDHRAPGERRIGVLVIDFGLAGSGIYRILQPDDHAAKAAAAFADPHPGVANLRQPDPGGLPDCLRPCDRCAHERGQNHKRRPESESHEPTMKKRKACIAVNKIYATFGSEFRTGFSACLPQRVSRTAPAVASPNTTMAAPTSANNVQTGASADDSHQPPMATIASLALDASTG